MLGQSMLGISTPGLQGVVPSPGRSLLSIESQGRITISPGTSLIDAHPPSIQQTMPLTNVPVGGMISVGVTPAPSIPIAAIQPQIEPGITQSDINSVYSNTELLSQVQGGKTGKKLTEQRSYNQETMRKVRRSNVAPLQTNDVNEIKEQYMDDIEVIEPSILQAASQKVTFEGKSMKHGLEKMMESISKESLLSLPELLHLEVSFRTLKEEDIEKLAVVNVVNNGKEGTGSINDPRMGTTGTDTECNCGMVNCAGHYGRIKFHRPIPDPTYLNSGAIIKVLNCICITCGELKLSKIQIESLGIENLPDDKRLDVLSEESKNKICDRTRVYPNGEVRRCPGKNPSYKIKKSKDDGHIRYTKKNETATEILPISDVMGAFSRISEESARIMGFPDKDVPMSFVKQSMLVPPISTRPPVIIKGAPRTSDLTELLIAVVNANTNLKTAIDAFESSNKQPNYRNPGLLCDTLQCLCSNCGNLRLNNEELTRLDSEHKLSSMIFIQRIPTIAHFSKIPCMICHNPSDYTYEKKISTNEIMYTVKGSNVPYSINRNDIITYLNRINDWNVVTLGLGTREALLDLADLVRPSIQPESSSKKNDSAASSVMTATNNLYNAVSIYHDFVDSLITGKEALIRKMMMAKRSDYCARGVISPDDSIRFGEIVIPEYMAKYLTPRIVVTADNIANIRKLMLKGRITHVTPRPGSIDERGNLRSQWSYSANSQRRTIEIEIGDTVERWLQTGDMVLAGRQPTIHKYNVMAYRAVVRGNRATIGFYLALTRAINGDFDGDEMSIWLPQSQDAVLEAFHRMYACRNIISQGTNAPVVTPTMDTVTSIFKMTSPTATIKPALITNILFHFMHKIPSLYRRLDMFKISPYSGRALFSLALPEDYIYVEKDIIIINGILIRGRITGSMLGSGHRSMVQDIYNYYGWERVSQFITDITNIARDYAEYDVISVGPDDCDYGESQIAKTIISREMATVNANVSKFGARTGNPIEDRNREMRIRGVLSDAKGAGVELSELAMDKDNTIRDMAKDGGGGAKGSVTNTNMMGGIIGQQFFEGGRIAMSMDNGTRTLIYYKPGTDTVRSRGFCATNYSKGTDPDEHYMHSMATRPQLADTPLNVGPIGDLHRKIAKATEGIYLYFDGSVRNFDGVIFQYIYGDDGFNSSKLMNVKTKSFGTVASFIDMKVIVNQVNGSYGWVPKPPDTEIRSQLINVDMIADNINSSYGWISKKQSFINPYPDDEYNILADLESISKLEMYYNTGEEDIADIYLEPKYV